MASDFVDALIQRENMSMEEAERLLTNSEEPELRHIINTEQGALADVSRSILEERGVLVDEPEGKKHGD